MERLITLKQFNAADRQYHIYRIRSSSIAHKPHYHNYFQICFVVSGELLHKQGQQAVLLGPGDTFLIPPGLSHSLQFTGKASQIYSLSFSPEVFDAGFHQSNAWWFLSQLQPDPVTPIPLRIVPEQDTCRQILSLIECLLWQQQSDCPAQLSAAAGIISAIVCLLAQSYYSQPQNANALAILTSQNNILLQCTQYIDSHYKENISLEALARHFGLSRATFCAVFPQQTGLSPHKYIAKKRIEEAQELIRSHPEKSLNLIAAEVGYDDPSTFYRNFLKITGISPTKYRQMHK